MPDLQQQLSELRGRFQALPEEADSAALSDLERAARRLLTDSKNTPYEAEAQTLFAELARASGPTSPTQATIRGLLRRARIRIEVAGDDDDIDDAIDILSEAVALNPQDNDVIAMLELAGEQNAQARQRVTDLFTRYNVRRSIPMPPAPSRAPAYSPNMGNGVGNSAGSAVPSVDDAPVLPSQRTSEFRAPQVNPTEGREPAPSNANYTTSAGYPPPERDLPRENNESRPNDGRSTGTQRRVPGQGPVYIGSDVDSVVSELTQAYYAGDYQQVVDLANRVLNVQPGNATAMEYRQKAEDNIIRGVVPDHRIPFDARVSYNRANSLVRAGNYDEAQRLFREARDLAERSGILTWKDAEAALLEIQDLALARELITEGDRLMATDNWGEALRKYEGALRVVPNDPAAEERIEKVRRLQQDAEAVSVQLTMLGGTIGEQVTGLQNILNTLARLRQLLPNSQRLTQLTTDVNNRINGIKAQVGDQAQAALFRANSATALEERLTLTGEARNLLEQGVRLDPADTSLSAMLLEARTADSNMQHARQVMERAAALIAQNLDTDLVQARSMLTGLKDNAQDSRYRTVVSDLLARIVERAAAAIDEGNLDEANALIDAAHEEPFTILGRRAEVARVEQQIRSLRGQNRLRLAGIAGGAIIIILLVGLLSRGTWEPLLFPPPTSTPTATYTPTETLTPSRTFTPSNTPTDTPLPTATYTASNTPTPSDTPLPTDTVTNTPTRTYTPLPTDTPLPTSTPEYLCQVVNINPESRFVRAEPDVNSLQVSSLPAGGIANVLEVVRNANNEVWYRIEFELSGFTASGWTRASNVTDGNDECPPV